MIRRASAKLENSFVTANFASTRAQLSKLERQRALLQNCGQIINKQQLFIFPNSLTIHQTPPLHNTFYFSNTWTKIQLRSDLVNMQPDETKCYPQRPITTLWPAACKMLSTSSGSPPLNSGTLSLHMERNCRIRGGAAGYWNVTFAERSSPNNTHYHSRQSSRCGCFSPGWNPTQPMHVSFNSDLKYVSQNKLTRY